MHPPGIPPRTLALTERLEAASIPNSLAPREAWVELHRVEGRRATMIDLYALVAGPRGLLPNELDVEERLELWRWAAPVIWPGFQIAEGSARRHDPIEVVDYDPAWPGQFATWRDRIAGALGDLELRIEHVGSTSVPGLAAKPRIDIQVSVADMADEDRYVSQIESAGIAQLRSRDHQHRFFRTFPGGPRVLQIHVCDAGSAWEREHLLFRDYLRAHAEARDAYAAVKRECAVIWSDDGIGYTDAKSEFILGLLEAARADADEPSRGRLSS